MPKFARTTELGNYRRALLRVSSVYRKDGACGVIRKIIRHLQRWLLLAAATPFVVFIRIIRPLCTVRFVPLNANRIGHFAGNTEIYLCERDAGKCSPYVWDIFISDQCTSCCNDQLMKMWRRVLNSSVFAYWVARVNDAIPGGAAHRVTDTTDRDICNLLERTPPHLTFSEREKLDGARLLDEMGIGKDEFICIHARDSAYLSEHVPNRDWHYHDHRDVDIDDLAPAAKALADRGYHVVRMGKVTAKPFNAAHHRIIDYARSPFRSDFMDIYLSAHCRFFVCDTAGLYAVPMIFRRPRVYVNVVPIEDVCSWDRHSISIFKLSKYKTGGRLLTFLESMQLIRAPLHGKEAYTLHDLAVIDNSPEDIRGIVLEMDDRLNGSWTELEDNEQRQKRFWPLFADSDYHGIINARIGSAFLEKYEDLLPS